MTRTDNERVLERGFNLAVEKIRDRLCKDLMDLGKALLDDPVLGGIPKMTGNTYKSLTAGVFYNKRLYDLVFMDGDMPIRKKLSKGEKFPKGTMRYDRDEQEQTFVAKVDTDGSYGDQTSIKFLSGYKPGRNGYCIVVCTGTEYSEFRALDNLTDNYQSARQSFLKSFKPIR